MKMLIVPLFALTLSAAGPEDAVRAAMNDFARCLVDADRAAAERLLADNVLYSHSDGRLETKQELIRDLMELKKTKYHALEYGPDTKIVIHGDTALVRGNAVVRNTPEGGEPRAIYLNLLQVWQKQKSGWRMIARQSTRMTAPAAK
jgi:ketosteroid isomerase-like protein